MHKCWQIILSYWLVCTGNSAHDIVNGFHLVMHKVHARKWEGHLITRIQNNICCRYFSSQLLCFLDDTATPNQEHPRPACRMSQRLGQRFQCEIFTAACKKEVAELSSPMLTSTAAFLTPIGISKISFDRSWLCPFH